MMFISRIRFSDAPSASSLLHLLGDRLGAYETHRLVWSLFSDDPDRRRDFLYRQDWQGGRPEFIAVSPREPVDGHNLFAIETKPYGLDLRAGDRLRLKARVNAVCRKDIGGGRRKIDVVMDEVHTRKAAGDAAPDRRDAAAVAIPRWLDGEGGRHGFALLPGSVAVQGYELHQFRTRAGQPVKVAATDLTAEVTVADPEACAAMLFTGLGSAKAFGFGLVLARRA